MKNRDLKFPLLRVTMATQSLIRHIPTTTQNSVLNYRKKENLSVLYKHTNTHNHFHILVTTSQ